MRTAAVAFCAVAVLAAADVQWRHITSRTGGIPDPGGSSQQTGIVTAKLDKSKADSIVISFRVKAPALVWLRRTPKGWTRYVIEKEYLPLEAGGAAYDIDRDGDLDLVWGEDWQGTRLWWWENPYPAFRPNVSWKRHLIKEAGSTQHHDQVFGDFKGTGRAQLVFWNQGAKTLYLAEIPSHPRSAGTWKLETVYSGTAGEDAEGAAKYAEGLDAFDVDGDGRVDLLAGNHWFKYQGNNQFLPVKVGSIGGRIRAGRFKPGRFAQIIIGPGDGTGPVRFYEAKDDPASAGSWNGRDLVERDIVHGHTLDIADVDRDGNLDVLIAEMAKWTEKTEERDYDAAAAWILYGDGRGGFRSTTLVTGHGWHEGRLADVDGDGDIDVSNKPYTWTAPRIDVWLNEGPAVSPR